MTGDEIRALFLSFFEEKEHKVIPSSSLIPRGDPTLLLTSAGMVQFKPYFLGEASPPAPRLASCQKCFRTTDIESVGDSGHLTFFEMLGNFSVGNYFKKEAIGWALEFVTERLQIPKERLWITIYLDDDESFRHWRELDVPEDRILRFGEKDNFWGPAGDSGPCGPCSEIHYDFGEEFGCGKDSCAPGCECGRFSEIWNLVFTQYNQDKEGNRTPLPKPNIDTGMGLERTAAALQGKPSVYDTDFFSPLLRRIVELSGKKYGLDNDTDKNLRVVVEHSRGIAFLIADGVIPENEGRGYVLRRLLRRAALFGRRLGLDKPFLSQMAQTTIEQMKPIYPELEQRRDFILKAVELEEVKFDETLSTGLDLLDTIMADVTEEKTNIISGTDAFKLYDTYGFPVEITKEIATGRCLSVDLDGFEKEMEKQRERARASHKFELDERLELKDKLDIQESLFVGYSNLENTSNIVGLIVENQTVDTIQEGQQAGVILASTTFYGEMGGQVGDTGEISGASGRFSVVDTIRMTPDIIIHQGNVLEGTLSLGDQVKALVDAERRLDIARNHTATHLLQYALRRVLGEHVQQRGSMVAPERFRFDFSHMAAMTTEEIQEVESIVNEIIRENLRVYDQDVPYREAIEEGAIALFDEKYGDVVRVLRIGEPAISTELCGGTHITSTGEIGYFHIISEGSIGAGLRRIEGVTGRGAERLLQKRMVDLRKIAECLGADLDDVLDKINSLLQERERERKLAMFMERELAKKEAEALLSRVETVNGVNLLVARVHYVRMELMREMSDFIRDKLESVIVVLGTIHEDRPQFLAAVTPDLVQKGYSAGEIVRQVARLTGGGGGGKANFAQAGGKDKDKMDEALQMVKSMVKGG